MSRPKGPPTTPIVVKVPSSLVPLIEQRASERGLSRHKHLLDLISKDAMKGQKDLGVRVNAERLPTVYDEEAR